MTKQESQDRRVTRAKRERQKQIKRETFVTSRLLDFFSEKELTAQTGHGKDDWPLVLLKELTDNALDEAEEAGIAPQINVTIHQDWIKIKDNGRGIPSEVVTNILDYAVRVSSREAYIAPDRGAQGNALKTIAAMPFVVDGEEGRVFIRSCSVRHDITVMLDSIKQIPLIEHTSSAKRNGSGTSVGVRLSKKLLSAAKARFLQFAGDFTCLNPYLSLKVKWDDSVSVEASDPDWSKWKPSDPMSPHWFGVDELSRLVSAYLAQCTDVPTVRAFVSQFSGLAGSAKQKLVLDATGLKGASLSELVDARGTGPDRSKVSALLTAMQDRSRLITPKRLGIIGKEHIAARFASLGCEMASFHYRKATGVIDGLPSVVEAAFAWNPSASARRTIIGINWSPAIVNPFRELGEYRESLDEILAEQRIDDDDAVVVLLHLVCPRVMYADRGKSSVVFDEESPIANSIIELVQKCTAKWAKQQKAEERDVNATCRRLRSLAAGSRSSIKDSVYGHIEDAYRAVSDDGQLPAHARQLMYETRRRIQDDTDEPLDDNYFTQTLLPDFMANNAEMTSDWDVVFNARGDFYEPHTERRVGLGTLMVREYCSQTEADLETQITLQRQLLVPALGPQHRFGAILFVEKEGFWPLLRKVKLADRFDIAIMSTKGVSNTASRRLVNELCGRFEIPLLVLHDFDNPGFQLSGHCRETRGGTNLSTIFVSLTSACGWKMCRSGGLC